MIFASLSVRDKAGFCEEELSGVLGIRTWDFLLSNRQFVASSVVLLFTFQVMCKAEEGAALGSFPLTKSLLLSSVVGWCCCCPSKQGKCRSREVLCQSFPS